MTYRKSLEILGELAAAYLIILIITMTWLGGEIYRGEISPWVWEQFSINVARHGTPDSLLLAALYMVFYSFGFTVPCIFLSILFTIKLDSARANEDIDKTGMIAATIAVSCACLIGFMVLLPSICEFIRSLPTEAWNGWLLFLAVVVGLFLLAVGGRGIKGELNTLYIKVRHSDHILCRCLQCGHGWSFPATQLRTNNIVSSSPINERSHDQ